MKKALSLVLALVLCLALAACGGSSTTSTASTSSTASTDAAPAAETAGESTDAAPAAESEAAVTYTVGICQLMQHDALDAATQGFRDALTEALGDAVVFDEQNAQGDSATCSTIVTGFVANDYDLIMANATPALQAAVSATTEIPVLGTSVTDYGAALDMTLAADGSTGINVAGSSDGLPGQLYVDLLLELVPEAKNVSILYCSAEANSVVQADDFIASMQATAPDVNCTVYTFSDSNDIQMVVTSAVENCDALYIPTDNQAASNMTIVQNVCAPAAVPVICGEENMCANGGLATVSISYYNIGYVCGQQAVEILRDGADVSAMPIAYASDPVKEYNADYAAAIGFTMPDGYQTIGG
ncbi:MAG: ABC transporter substrate-binding protein [Oscillospiraceae bacterium]|nr:ABC transporter substrate-binding protein [Oscillospiraceae bacterium]